MTNKLGYLVIALMGAAILVAGCGDDSAETTGGAQATATNAASQGEEPGGDGSNAGGGGEGADADKAGNSGNSASAKEFAEFAKEANGICTRRTALMLAKVQAHVKENSGQGKSEKELQAESVNPIFVPNIEAEIRELRELDLPSGREARVESFLEAMDDAVAVTKKKEHPAATIEDFGHEYDEAGEMAHALGIDSCAFG